LYESGGAVRKSGHFSRSAVEAGGAIIDAVNDAESPCSKGARREQQRSHRPDRDPGGAAARAAAGLAYSTGFGYYPVGGVGLIVVIVAVLLLAGKI
jgi:hypothetical protein